VTSTALVSSPNSQFAGSTPWRTADGSLVDVESALLAYRDGDDRALQTLMTTFGRVMTSVARRYLRCNQDVEDAVQDAWMSFVRSAHAIESPAAVGGWLVTTTARAALRIAHQQSRCLPSDLALEAPAAIDDHDPAVAEAETAVVRDAVGRLQSDDRELIAMLFDAQMSYTEIHARTGRPVGSIGPTRQRVMSKLRADRSIRRLTLDTTV
jgi:RNA polymerase sigma factor (sigma-70 family)